MFSLWPNEQELIEAKKNTTEKYHIVSFLVRTISQPLLRVFKCRRRAILLRSTVIIVRRNVEIPTRIITIIIYPIGH